MSFERPAHRVVGILVVTGLAVFPACFAVAAPPAAAPVVAQVAAPEAPPEPAEEPEPGALRARIYMVVFNKGPAYVEGGPHPGMAEHVPFIKGLHADGVVPLAGALFDDGEQPRLFGLLYFVRADSLDEARELVAREPLVLERVAEVASIRMFAAGVGSLD